MFYTPVKAVLDAEKSVWVWKWDGSWKEALSQHKMFWEPVFSLKNTGAVITGKSGNVLFALPGILCVVLLVVVFLAAVIQFGNAFWKQGRVPFCEVSGKWAKETVIDLKCQTEEIFLSRLLLGDTAVLAELEPLGSEDTDCYFKVSMFAADRSTTFYVSVSKMTKAEKQQTQGAESHSDVKPKRRKKPAYREEQVAEYLVLDRGTGLLLLSRSQMDEIKKGTF